MKEYERGQEGEGEGDGDGSPAVDDGGRKDEEVAGWSKEEGVSWRKQYSR